MRPQLFMYFHLGAPTVDVFGQLYSRNLDPSASDYCANIAGYSESNLKIFKSGGFIINADCSISLNNFEYPNSNPSFLVDPTQYIGGGPSIKYTIISDHYMEQTISGSGGDGGSSIEFVASLFERKSDLDPTGTTTIWYD